MDGDPDFLAALRMNEEQVAALAGAPLDEAGRLQLPDDFFPSHCPQNNLSLGSQQLVWCCRARIRPAKHFADRRRAIGVRALREGPLERGRNNTQQAKRNHDPLSAGQPRRNLGHYGGRLKPTPTVLRRDVLEDSLHQVSEHSLPDVLSVFRPPSLECASPLVRNERKGCERSRHWAYITCRSRYAGASARRFTP